MIKRIVFYLLIFLTTFFFHQINFNASQNNFRSFFYFGSDSDPNKQVRIDISAFAGSDVFSLAMERIDVMFNLYHQLTNIYIPNTLGINGAYEINNNPETWVEIPEELFNLLKFSLDMNNLTNGYFDITIGSVIAYYKNATNNYFQREISDYSFFTLLQNIENVRRLMPNENRLLLRIVDNLFYVKIADNVMLDFGAITKGYATNKAKEILLSYGIKVFSINAGHSSIALGYRLNNANLDSFNVHCNKMG